MFKLLMIATLLTVMTWTMPVVANEAAPLDLSTQELRDSVGGWSVVTEFLDDEGAVLQTSEGSYHFEWVVPDRVLRGKSSIPDMDMNSAILFYISESREVIEMVSVGKDGKLWVMTGELGGDTRYTQMFETQSGGEAQLRFTRYNVVPEGFESKMEYSDDGGATWKQGNHQLFRRQQNN